MSDHITPEMPAGEPDLLDWYPFHISHWPRSIVEPAEYQGGERLNLSWDLGRVDEKQKKAVIKAWCAELPKMRQVRWLNLWTHVTAPLFEAVCRMPNLECMQIKWSNLKSLEGIQNLAQLRYLAIGSSTKITSIEPLTALTRLRLLSIENFKLISDFAPLRKLTALEYLAVSGSMWTNQKVASLEPFAQMDGLKSLFVDTSAIDSLSPLARLRGLRRLNLPGNLPMVEYARLAARMPETECRWFAPWLDLAQSGIGRCEECKGDTKVMITGKGGGVLCRVCQQARVQKHEAAYIAAYEIARAQAKA